MKLFPKDDFNCIPRDKDILHPLGSVKEKKYSTHHFKLNSKIIRA